MDKTPNQEEFNALLQMVEERRKPHVAEELAHAVPWDIRRAGTLSTEEVQVIRSLHDTFARILTDSLGSHLHGSFEIVVAVVEQITYSEFVQRVPEPRYVASIALHPLQATAAIGLDMQLALPVIDMLLGGSGSAVGEVREVTEIEEEILRSVVELICRGLEAAWLPVLKLDFRFGRRQDQAQLLRLMSPREKVLSLSLEVRTAGSQGMLNLAFPTAVINALLKEVDEQGSLRPQESGSSRALQLRKLLENCPFHVELLSPAAPISARKLMQLKVGEILEFTSTVAEPTLFKVENQTLFLASPVAMGDRRAAEMLSIGSAPKLIKEELN
jgi:flagellar motor switch protein FliM